jgi:hypothetical protein
MSIVVVEENVGNLPASTGTVELGRLDALDVGTPLADRSTSKVLAKIAVFCGP